MADHIAVLAAPGKLVANGSPVTLKRDLGQGYSVQVTFETTVAGEKDLYDPPDELLQQIRALAPGTYISSPSPRQILYHLKNKSSSTVNSVLQLLEQQQDKFKIASYDILGTTIEDVFLDLMAKNDVVPDDSEKVSRSTISASPELKPSIMKLPSGRPTSPFRQALTIFHKRILIARRSWLTPLLTVLIAVAGSTIPLVFMVGKRSTCTRRFANSTTLPLYLPTSPIVPFTFGPSSRVLNSPPGIISTLGSSTGFFRVTNITDNATFVDTIANNYRNLSLGGVSIDLTTGASLFAWEASPPGLMGPSMLNLASNILYNHALNTSGNSASIPTIIRASYSNFPAVSAGTLFALKWVVFFGAAMVRTLVISV